MDLNMAFEAALDTAFEKARMHQGNASLGFEGGTCTIILKNGDRVDQIDLRSEDTKVFFYPKSNSAYGVGKKERMRKHYAITFPEGTLTVNGRNRTTVINYSPSVRHGSRR